MEPSPQGHSSLTPGEQSCWGPSVPPELQAAARATTNMRVNIRFIPYLHHRFFSKAVAWHKVVIRATFRDVGFRAIAKSSRRWGGSVNKSSRPAMWGSSTRLKNQPKQVPVEEWETKLRSPRSKKSILQETSAPWTLPWTLPSPSPSPNPACSLWIGQLYQH